MTRGGDARWTVCLPRADDHEAEMDALAAQVEAAGLLETFVRDDGKVAYLLTETGAGVGRAHSMSGDGSAELLDALLGPED